jgi:hypothetical protein
MNTPTAVLLAGLATFLSAVDVRAQAAESWAEPMAAMRAARAQAASVPAAYDAEKAAAFGKIAEENSLGAFKGRCYEFVADAMEKAGIIRDEQWSALGIGPDHAADFADWAEANLGAMRSELGLAKLDTPAAVDDFPVGAIVVYERGQCGFSAKSGHIEVVVRRGFACSDGCEILWQDCVATAADRARVHVYIPVK